MRPYDYDNDSYALRSASCGCALPEPQGHKKVIVRFLKLALFTLIVAPWPLLAISVVLFMTRSYFALGVVTGASLLFCLILGVVLFTLRQAAKEERAEVEEALKNPAWWREFQQQFKVHVQEREEHSF